MGAYLVSGPAASLRLHRQHIGSKPPHAPLAPASAPATRCQLPHLSPFYFNPCDSQLRQTPAFRDADIIRSRDPEVLATADVVIDVGGVYDPAAQVSTVQM